MISFTHSQCILRLKIWLVLSSFFCLLSSSALAFSNITVMADEAASVAVVRLAREYARETGVGVATSFLPKESQAAQILEGSAADVLMTADTKWLAELQRMGLIDIYSKQAVATGQLALVGRADTSLVLPLKPNASTAPLIHAMHYEPELFLGSPDAVSEGKYAKQSMRNLTMNDTLEPYTLYLKSTDEIIDQVTKNGAYGVVNYGKALLLNNIKIIGRFPHKSHEPMTYYAVVIAGDHMDEARNFLKFLKTSRAEQTIHRSGFIAPTSY